MTRLGLAILCCLPASLWGSTTLFDTATRSQPLAALGSGSRGSALGAGYMALARGADAIEWNPGGLAWSENIELGLNHSSWLVETIEDSLLLALPTSSLGNFGLALRYTGFGSFDVRDSSGVLVGATTAYDLGGSFAWSFKAHPSLGVGLVARVTRATLDDSNEISFAGDVGLQWKVPIYGLLMGAAYRNLGPPVDDSSQVASFRLGISRPISFPHLFEIRPMLGVNIETESGHAVGLGLEMGVPTRGWARVSYSRAMHDPGTNGLQGLAAGLGFFLGPARVDYSWIPFGDLGDAHRFSLGWEFGRQSMRREVPAVETSETSQPESVETPSSVRRPTHAVEAALWKVLRNDPNNVAAWDRLGRHYHQRGDRELAIKAFERRLRLSSDAALQKWLKAYKQRP